MKGFTIIIPTMWYFPKELDLMVSRYNKIIEVKEILIINNRKAGQFVLPYKKVRVIGTGKNMFVNPAWNLGVQEAKTDKVILANDDIKINSIKALIVFIDHIIKIGRIIGMDTSCYKGIVPAWDTKPIIKMNYGFGVFMAITKESYISIPKEFKVWYGDAIQFKNNEAVVISGCKIRTPMRGTSRKLDLSRERRLEGKAWKKYCV